MKIFSKDVIRQWDDFSINNDYLRSIDLMESAAKSFVHWFQSLYFNKSRRIILFAGAGNNGGDAMAIARLLHLDDYEVIVYLFRFGSELKPDCAENLKKCVDLNIQVVFSESFEIDRLDRSSLYIDGLFGSGLNRKLEDQWEAVVQKINRADLEVVSVDIPSGIDADSGLIGPAIHASRTLTFEIPKFAFFLDECQEYLGEWTYRPIGLSPLFYDTTPSEHQMLTRTLVSKVIKKRKIIADKSKFGFAQLCGGSRGMLGAIILASRSAMRSGLGRLVVTTPSIHHQSIFVSIPVAMVQDLDQHDAGNLNSFTLANDQITALAFGPGMGVNEETLLFTKAILEESLPIIIDADGLNVIARYDLHNHLPKDSILTPHKIEFARLFGHSESHYEMLQKQVRASKKHQIYIVLKGNHTSISTPGGELFFNNCGNPGMASAGSGDVLTGFLLGLLAQGYSALEACQLGVYLHGKSGDLAAVKFGEMAMNAEDIITFLPAAIKNIDEK